MRVQRRGVLVRPEGNFVCCLSELSSAVFKPEAAGCQQFFVEKTQVL